MPARLSFVLKGRLTAQLRGFGKSADLTPARSWTTWLSGSNPEQPGNSSCCLKRKSRCSAKSPSTSVNAPRFTTNGDLRPPAREVLASRLVRGPGTGKTMAGEVLANELNLDLYRIDLSQVVNKYIGKTEKNLKRVFDAAEKGGAHPPV